MKRAPVSLCMIVRNEEAHLERCLRSIRPFVEEICVVDTGSTDRTPEIARRYVDRFEVDTSHVVDGVLMDFAAARNLSYDLASPDVPWRMWMDADDFLRGGDLLADLCRALEARAKETGTRRHIGKMLYWFHPPTARWSLRIVPTAAKPRWRYPIHEMLEWERSPATGLFGVDLVHTGYLSFEALARKIVRNRKIVEHHYRAGNRDPRLMEIRDGLLADDPEEKRRQKGRPGLRDVMGFGLPRTLPVT